MIGRLLVVVGSGPGIGSATATRFALEGFNIALLSRNAERLKEDANRVTLAVSSLSSSVTINTYAVDVGDHEALKATLDKVKNELGPPEVVLFNAARVAPSEFGNIPVSRLSEDFQVMNIGLYVTATWAVPLLEATKKEKQDSHPSFFITGGGIWQHPDHEVFALSMQKAAQVNFAGSLLQVAKPKGIHVATVSVNGVVENSNPVINAKSVAGQFWDLYIQKPDQWASLVQVGDLENLIK